MKKSPLNDVYVWLALCQKGNVVYIAEPLSCFRQYAGQDQNSIQLHFRGGGDWYELGVAYEKNIRESYERKAQGFVILDTGARTQALGQMHMQHSVKGKIFEMNEYY